jgi:TfoX/Sxy family transcriptional regulator of competence genes
MAYDEAVARRIRAVLKGSRSVEEKKMFGGLAFMIRGKMCVGVVGKKLMVRVGPKEYKFALAKPHVREMDFTGKPLTGFVYVTPGGFAKGKDLKTWITLAKNYVTSIGAK